MKKIISIFMCALILVALSVTAVSSVEHEALYFGRIAVTMPEITAEVKGKGYDVTDISATLGSDKLTVSDVQEYDKKSHKTRTYVLVDLSTSMYYYFDLVKENILNYVDSMGDDDSLVLITFGQNEVNVTLDGNESYDEIVSTVMSLDCNEYGTLFYEALSKAYDLANSSISDYDREYVVAFSDGIDEQIGNITFDEVVEDYATHNLPLYSACFDNYDQSAIDKFGELSRSSGGSLMMIYDTADFDALVEEINDVSLIAMSAGNNFADGSSKLLSVKIGDRYLEKQIPVVRALSDTVAPVVTGSTLDEENCVLTVQFSEKVCGSVLEKTAYRLTGPDGKAADILSVEYDDANMTLRVWFSCSESGEYTLTFNGITDFSQESNAVADTVVFNITRDAVQNDGNSMPLWGVILIVLVVLLIAGAVLLAVFFSRRATSEEYSVVGEPSANNRVNQEHFDYAQEAPQVKHHVMMNCSKKVRLIIRTGNVSEQTIETVIHSSLIVGRSNTCDIFIDDTKLSRQHFVIEYDSDSFYIMDLQSRNGTILNGYKVSGRQNLKSGDKIIAGLSDIRFNIVG